MIRTQRTAARPAIETMESRALMAAQILNPVITVDETTAGTMEIHVLSQAGVHPFQPVNELLPGTVRVDGIAFAHPTLTADPIDVNGDGIPDAVLTVSARPHVPLPPVGSAVWVAGVDRFRVAGRPVLWDGAAVVTRATTGGGLGSPVAAQAYIGTVGLITPTNLNLNVLSVSPTPGTYGYTPGVGPLRLVAGQGARITTGAINYFNTANLAGTHGITLQIPLGSTFAFNNASYRLSIPGGTIPVYQLIYTGTGNNYTLKLVQG